MKSSVISDIDVHIEGHDSVEFAKLQHCISKGVLSTILAKCRGMADEPILVTGKIGDIDVDIPVEDSCSLSGRCLSALFAFVAMSEILSKKQTMTDEMKEKCIALSKASGVLCEYTSFVGVSEKRYVPPRVPICDAAPVPVPVYRGALGAAPAPAPMCCSCSRRWYSSWQG